ncbi:MAG: hypothetical protein RQ751_01035, partial [Longimicrobiales bacterium]|nr:hypothetical protein [Longimicrobiales bacterium]
MEPRFIYRSASGDEVKVPSLGDLTRLVEVGTISPGTPLFDRLAGGWAPARTHPVFRLIREEAGLDPDPPGEEPAGGEPTGADPLDVVLTPRDPSEADQDLVEAFLEARERERRDEDMRSGAGAGTEGLTLVDSGQREVGGASTEASSKAPPPAPPEAEVEAAEPPSAEAGSAEVVGEHSGAGSDPAPEWLAGAGTGTAPDWPEGTEVESREPPPAIPARPPPPPPPNVPALDAEPASERATTTLREA